MRPPPACRATISSIVSVIGPPLSASVKQESYDAGASGMELARRRAPLRGLGIAESAKHEVERRIADAEPFLLADEMMAKMVLLHPAAHAGSRRIGNVRDIMHPFVGRIASMTPSITEGTACT